MTSVTELAPDGRARIEALLSEFGWRVDHGGNVGALFTPDGVLLAPGIGLELHGREAISDHFAARGTDAPLVTRHVWSALRLVEFVGNVARLNTIQTTFLRLPGEQPTAKHVMVGETHDVARWEQSGEWLFHERRLEVIFPFDVNVGESVTQFDR